MGQVFRRETENIRSKIGKEIHMCTYFLRGRITSNFGCLGVQTSLTVP